MLLDRRPDEGDFAYHRRLVSGKLVDKTLADVDYSELAELLYGKPYSSDVARRMMYGSRFTLDLLDSENMQYSPTDLLGELEEKTISLKKERQKLFDERNAFNKLIRDRSRQEELNEILVRCVTEGGLQQLCYEPVEVAHSNNDLLVSLNDIHYGAVVDNYWNKYDSNICADMMRNYLHQIIAIAERHNSENCIVWSNGDAVSGIIHHSIAVTNKETVIEQVKGVSELIAEFLAELSSHFKTVSFVSVAGNHSRINPDYMNAV